MDREPASDFDAFLRLLAAPGDPAEAVAVVRRLGPSGAQRSQVAVAMICSLLGGDTGINVQSWKDQPEAIEELVAIADEASAPLPFWPQIRRLTVFILRMTGALRRGEDIDPDVLRAEFAGLPPGMFSPEQLTALQDLFAVARAGKQGDGSTIIRTATDFSQLDVPGTDALSGRLAIEILQESQELKTAQLQGDQATVREMKARIRSRPGPLARPGLDPSDPAVQVLAVARASQASLVGGDDDLPVLEEAEVEFLEVLAAREDPPPAYRAMFHLVLGQENLKHAGKQDARLIRSAIAHFKEVPRLVEAADPAWVLSRTWLGAAVLRYVELTADGSLLAETGAALDEARRFAGGPGHPSWSFINSLIARIEDRLGGSAAHLTAVDGLRRQIWQVLLEDDPRAARTAARQAARFAFTTASACLTGNDPVAAIRALESGRSLMLFSAARLSDLAPQLEAAGHADLAERWRRRAESGEPDGPAGALRHEVLSVLAQTTDLLDPPDPAQIAGALRALDADALVYLVPATEKSRGYAVIAPAQGTAGYIVLGRNLREEGSPHLDQFLSTLPQASRDLDPAVPRTGPAENLDALCAWAWDAAVGPLLDDYISTLPRPAGGRPYRIYLVPVGALALVPWPAAKRPGGGHALAEAAFSMVGSARMLCRAAQLRPVPPDPAALVVGDPDTGGAAGPLFAARAEAYAVHQAFYRAGRYIGTRPNGTPGRSGPGSAGQVREWLADGGPESGAGNVLHMACHGYVDTGFDTANARLVLAGGETVAADEIVSLLNAPADRRLSLVVLAACSTGVSAHDYDEAYSLGTAFLTGGARTVLSTQWPVSDEATCVMMFMFHHFLMGRRLPAWEALRRAQLWMLDPDRTPPPTMPVALRERLARAGAGAALSRVEAWAGFVHLGR